MTQTPATKPKRPQAIVTGGTRGIGRGICLELAQKGYDIAFTYRSNPEAAQTLTEELEKRGAHATGFQVDMSQASDMTKTMETILATYSQPEVLINNAGISIDGLSLRYKVDDWDRIFDTNVRGAFLCTQAVLRPMMKARHGTIVFISSVIGVTGNAGQVAYSGSKAALLAMTKSLAQEVGSRGIRINAIAPGFIATDMTESLPDSTKQSILGQIPLGEIGTVEDIAQTVSFLVSPAARYITGQTIHVNGGLYM